MDIGIERSELANAVAYRDAFVKNKQGEKVLADLTQKYLDQVSHVKGDPYETAFNEGKRAVVLDIMAQILAGENAATQESK